MNLFSGGAGYCISQTAATTRARSKREAVKPQTMVIMINGSRYFDSGDEVSPRMSRIVMFAMTPKTRLVELPTVSLCMDQ